MHVCVPTVCGCAFVCMQVCMYLRDAQVLLGFVSDFNVREFSRSGGTELRVHSGPGAERQKASEGLIVCWSRVSLPLGY